MSLGQGYAESIIGVPLTETEHTHTETLRFDCSFVPVIPHLVTSITSVTLDDVVLADTEYSFTYFGVKKASGEWPAGSSIVIVYKTGWVDADSYPSAITEFIALASRLGKGTRQMKAGPVTTSFQDFDASHPAYGLLRPYKRVV